MVYGCGGREEDGGQVQGERYTYTRMECGCSGRGEGWPRTRLEINVYENGVWVQWEMRRVAKFEEHKVRDTRMVNGYGGRGSGGGGQVQYERYTYIRMVFGCGGGGGGAGWPSTR